MARRMVRVIAAIVALAVGWAGLAAAPADPEAAPRGKTVYIIPLSGMVGRGMLASFERRLEQARAAQADLIIIEIDTWGGELFNTKDIADGLLEVTSPRLIAYIPKKGISAGALLAMAAHEIVMHPRAVLGDIIPHAGDMKESPEKIKTMVRTIARYCAARKYPAILAEAMVDTQIEVRQYTLQSGQVHHVRPKDAEAFEAEHGADLIYIATLPTGEKKLVTREELAELADQAGFDREEHVRPKFDLVVEKGQVLTMTGDEAHEKYGFAKHVVSSRDELLALYGAEDAEVVELGASWSEDLVQTIDPLLPMLIPVGLIALWIELRSPGFGLPGMIGVLALGLFFYSKHLAGLAEEWEILLFFIGISLLAIEIFLLPGFGVTGISGIILIVLAIILSMQDFVLPGTEREVGLFQYNLAVLGICLAVSFIGGGVIGKYLHRVPIFRKLALAATMPAEVHAGGAVAEQKLSVGIGAVGVAQTQLRPVGKAEFGDQTVSVMAEGNVIERGRSVQVVKIEGNRVMVREV